MELKVWVDGVARVVCGLSEETSCQDVVITLAQAIGQTGRYVLVQKLRDRERQLLANERLLDSMTKLGQNASEIQFFLRRVGSENQEGPVLDKGLALPKQPETENTKRKEIKKSLTFNLGPSSTPTIRPKQKSKVPRGSEEQRMPHHLPTCSVDLSKEELFQQVVQQQARLQTLEAQLEALEQEVDVWEQVPTLIPEPQEDKLEAKLEAKLKKNLRTEEDQELAMQKRLGELQQMLESYERKLQDLTAHSGELEIQLENIRRQSQTPYSGLEESLGTVKDELQNQLLHGAELEDSLMEVEQAAKSTEALLQAKTEEMEELNKELRQCDLQQFIQQTGTLPGQSHTQTHPVEQPEHPEHPEQPEQTKLTQLLPSRCNNGSGMCRVNLPPRSAARQLLGNPRNLLNPIISSLNPEGVLDKAGGRRCGGEHRSPSSALSSSHTRLTCDVCLSHMERNPELSRDSNPDPPLDEPLSRCSHTI
ncbi:ras association domain-containing protein 7b isoform X1 [Scleropages formosus]|uniref:Ras association domain family member 7b n=2 Tax=Scleropages formosus TaxID=113540 RepID=A0A8C9TVW8_SCLFO|nr:ras association domain-containing protein 8-like isoform X1 [Scleropages formosus]XP_018607889.2 ras association domain-containing protein 8-like isoform X1 [Scleropages formosus]XP_018607890.2 ras association domain-containing protein 8-like isoform X1 [Scleropages formosus]XP_018607891.2 ras association domain-containing protein 8-like isoform X1 [Scleropages formosus]XP_018607892.2 ras association domain-containing protein 8-like isoform X1 [Scleropages formosus]